MITCYSGYSQLLNTPSHHLQYPIHWILCSHKENFSDHFPVIRLQTCDLNPSVNCKCADLKPGFRIELLGKEVVPKTSLLPMQIWVRQHSRVLGPLCDHSTWPGSLLRMAKVVGWHWHHGSSLLLWWCQWKAVAPSMATHLSLLEAW
jgi:hypothetical protein